MPFLNPAYLAVFSLGFGISALFNAKFPIQAMNCLRITSL